MYDIFLQVVNLAGDDDSVILIDEEDQENQHQFPVVILLKKKPLTYPCHEKHQQHTKEHLCAVNLNACAQQTQ